MLIYKEKYSSLQHSAEYDIDAGYSSGNLAGILRNISDYTIKVEIYILYVLGFLIQQMKVFMKFSSG